MNKLCYTDYRHFAVKCPRQQQAAWVIKLNYTVNSSLPAFRSPVYSAEFAAIDDRLRSFSAISASLFATHSADVSRLLVSEINLPGIGLGFPVEDLPWTGFIVAALPLKCGSVIATLALLLSDFCTPERGAAFPATGKFVVSLWSATENVLHLLPMLAQRSPPKKLNARIVQHA
jgi:hypothetical protein